MPALFIFYTFLIKDVSKRIIEKCIIKQFHYPTTYLLCKESTKFTESRNDHNKTTNVFVNGQKLAVD